ncbi:hypothetical protein Taro_022062 [Colocasia esculenta]|uniref:Uncharacterized protein n=1 Tax=Colocasia esculenta TaxID=4460 RepID=A0A843V0T4_COLES|nr:hypothetical protein [Colocasia esculenta]
MEKCAVVLGDSPALEGPPAPPEGESLLAALVYDVSQQVQSALRSMLKMTGEIHEISCGITDEMEKCKESVADRKKALDEEKECVQKAAYAALQMLRAEEFN